MTGPKTGGRSGALTAELPLNDHPTVFRGRFQVGGGARRTKTDPLPTQALRRGRSNLDLCLIQSTGAPGCVVHSPLLREGPTLRSCYEGYI
jgi:hypothetical protein